LKKINNTSVRHNIIKEILFWKEKREAIILAHYYQPAEVQEIADYTGDSLALSQQAAKTDSKVIVFCGVHFMAETAAILSPEKIILLPDIKAGCPLADMASPDEVKKKKKELSQAVVISYVNTSAEVKSLSDYCCTSSNAIQVVQAIFPGKDILFLPDQNLAHFTAQKTKRKIIPWPGYCPIHETLSKEEVIQAKKLHPRALFLVHPECRPEVCDLADYIGSTKGIIDFVSNSPHNEFIIGTEKGIIFPLKKKNPDKEFFWASESMTCPDMKLISLDKILYSLKELAPRVTVPDHLRKKSLRAINRMIKIT